LELFGRGKNKNRQNTIKTDGDKPYGGEANKVGLPQSKQTSNKWQTRSLLNKHDHY